MAKDPHNLIWIDLEMTGYVNGRFVVQASALSGARFRPGQTVSDPAVDSILADLDAGPSSELAVAWRAGVGGTDPGVGTPGLDAALRSPGGSAFGAAEVIEQGTTANEAVLRFDPSSGRAVAAWNDLQSIRTLVRPPLGQPSG